MSAESHDMAVQRMIQAGVVPITWMAVGSEFQRDWAREETVAAWGEAVTPHAGGSAVVYAWEVQLLNTPVPGA